MDSHYVNGHELVDSVSPDLERVLLGMGCFWGAERLFWQQKGVVVTAVGYAGGAMERPTYEQVCSGLSGHVEVVQVVFDPKQIAFDAILKLFWSSHDPTQGMRQGNDTGSQYRSAIYFYDGKQEETIERSRVIYQALLSKAGFGHITTEILPAPRLYLAESYHQQYLAKNPAGYCSLRGTGVVY